MDDDDFDKSEEPTPADSPTVAIVRLATHQRLLCEAFDRVAPIIETVGRSDRAFALEKLIELCQDGENAFSDCKKALVQLYDQEMINRPKKL